MRVGEHLEELLVELVRERRGTAHDEADMCAQVVVLHCGMLVSLSIRVCLCFRRREAHFADEHDVRRDEAVLVNCELKLERVWVGRRT